MQSAALIGAQLAASLGASIGSVPPSSLSSSRLSASMSAPHCRASGTSRARRSGSKASRSEEHTSELQSLMRISYAVFCLKKKHNPKAQPHTSIQHHSDQQSHNDRT